LKDVKIIATGFAVPEHVVTNDDLSKILDTSDEWIVKRTGIKRRHISQNENTSDLATRVAKTLLSQSNVRTQDIDLIVVATMTPKNKTRQPPAAQRQREAPPGKRRYVLTFQRLVQAFLMLLALLEA